MSKRVFFVYINVFVLMVVALLLHGHQEALTDPLDAGFVILMWLCTNVNWRDERNA